MSDMEKYLIAGLVILVLLRRKSAAPVGQEGLGDLGPADDFERPEWGVNWISNQWAMIHQGQAASAGQIKAGGYL